MVSPMTAPLNSTNEIGWQTAISPTTGEVQHYRNFAGGFAQVVRDPFEGNWALLLNGHRVSILYHDADHAMNDFSWMFGREKRNPRWVYTPNESVRYLVGRTEIARVTLPPGDHGFEIVIEEDHRTLDPREFRTLAMVLRYIEAEIAP